MERERIFDRNSKRGEERLSENLREIQLPLVASCGILRAAHRAMEMERIWRQYPEDDAGWMSM